MDKEMVEISSVEFAMAAVIAEANTLDPATLEEARRRMDWPKWDLAIKVELEALKKAGTWGVVERGILLRANGYCTSRRMRGREDRALQGPTCCQRIHSSLLQN